MCACAHFLGGAQAHAQRMLRAARALVGTGAKHVRAALPTGARRFTGSSDLWEVGAQVRPTHRGYGPAKLVAVGNCRRTNRAVAAPGENHCPCARFARAWWLVIGWHEPVCCCCCLPRCAGARFVRPHGHGGNGVCWSTTSTPAHSVHSVAAAIANRVCRCRLWCLVMMSDGRC